LTDIKPKLFQIYKRAFPISLWRTASVTAEESWVVLWDPQFHSLRASGFCFMLEQNLVHRTVTVLPLMLPPGSSSLCSGAWKIRRSVGWGRSREATCGNGSAFFLQHGFVFEALP